MMLWAWLAMRVSCSATAVTMLSVAWMRVASIGSPMMRAALIAKAVAAAPTP